METNWNERYVKNDKPWDTNHPCSELQRVLDEYNIAPGRVLELGCGTGTNAVYLASRGFDVTGIDLAPAAIDAARRRAASAGENVQFMLADIFKLPDLGPPYDFIYDRGCFHVVRQTDEPRVVGIIEQHLSKTGHLLVLAGNAEEENPPQEGPPRVSEAEIRKAFESFQLLHLRPFHFDKIVGRDYRPLAWSMLARKK